MLLFRAIFPSLPYVSNFSVSRLQFHPDCISLEFLRRRIFYNCIYILGPLPMIALLGKNLPPKIVFACLTRLWLVKLPIQNYWCWKAQLYGKTSMKKTFSLGHCPIHLTSPPPMTPIGAIWAGLVWQVWFGRFWFGRFGFIGMIH